MCSLPTRLLIAFCAAALRNELFCLNQWISSRSNRRHRRLEGMSVDEQIARLLLTNNESAPPNPATRSVLYASDGL